MRKKTEQRASSANRSSRREKISARFPSFERKELPSKQDGIRQLNTEQYLDLLPKKNNNRSLSSVQPNLPEFLHFQSDHLRLSSDRSRGSSAFSLAKSNRQSNNTLPSPIPSGAASSNLQSGSSPRASYATSKRSARSRQAHDSTINHSGAQPVQAHLARPSSFRQMTSKFDAIGCFHEVSRRVISFCRGLALSSSAQAENTVAGPRGGQMTRTKTHTSTELNSIIIDDNHDDDDDDDSWTNRTSKMGDEEED